MRQRRWLELVKDYDSGINYHPGKENIITDALSRKTPIKVGCLVIEEETLVREFEMMRWEVFDTPETMINRIVALVATPDLRKKIISAQRKDETIKKLRRKIRTDKPEDYSEAPDDAIVFEGRFCIPHNDELKNDIMSEAHDTSFIEPPRSTKKL